MPRSPPISRVAMTEDDLRGVLARYPELHAGVHDHLDEVVRIAARILETEQRPPQPLPWAGLPDLERARHFDATYPPRGRHRMTPAEGLEWGRTHHKERPGDA